MTKAWGTVARGQESVWGWSQDQLAKARYTNQQGLSRKVGADLRIRKLTIGADYGDILALIRSHQAFS